MRALARFIVARLVAATCVVLVVSAATCLLAQTADSRVGMRQWQREWSVAPSSMRAHLRRIAQCESGGDHRAVSAGGTYRGLLQFDYGTWSSVGGRGDPAAASRWEQWGRGVRLYRARGPAPWPACRSR